MWPEKQLAEWPAIVAGTSQQIDDADSGFFLTLAQHIGSDGDRFEGEATEN